MLLVERKPDSMLEQGVFLPFIHQEDTYGNYPIDTEK